MSPSLIRCLLAVLALSEVYETILSKDVAYLLGVKRPTVHRALEVLNEKGLIQKAPYGDISLTDAGAKLAQTMERTRDDLILLFSDSYGLSPAESAKANRTFFSGRAAASARAQTLLPTKTMIFAGLARSVSKMESSCV